MSSYSRFIVPTLTVNAAIDDMYKLLLCWRYLRTRWIALASVISVTLGVATMIVVNAVMAGFSNEMQTRIHGLLSDIISDMFMILFSDMFICHHSVIFFQVLSFLSVISSVVLL